MKRDPANAMLYAAAAVVFITLVVSSCPADAKIVRVTVYEDSDLLDLHCPHDLACRVGHMILIPGDRGLICDRPVAVVMHTKPIRRAFARWDKGAIHMVRMGWRHPRLYQLGDALQQACDYWRRSTTELWAHELKHLLGGQHP